MAEELYFDYHEAEAGKSVLVFADEPFDEFALTTDKLYVSESFATSEILDPSEKTDLYLAENTKIEESLLHKLSYSDSFNPTSERTLFFNRQSLAPPYHYETWYIELPTVGTNIGRILKTYFMGLIQDVTIHCKCKGTSGQTKIDIKLNGVSIFSSDSVKPTLSYNASSNSASSDSIINGIVSKDDELSLDIEEVATGVEGLTVTLTIAIISTPINVHSVTAIDNNNFSYTEKTNILTGNSTQIKFKVVFSTALFYTPTIQLVNNTTYETITLELDELATTSVAGDTVITKSIDTSNLVGDYTLIIKDGASFSGTTHTPYKANFIFLSTSISNFLGYDRYTNNSIASITIDLTALTFLSDYSYSLDGINWTEATELSSPFIIDITNSEVGGSNTEEDKTIYLRFSNPHTSGYLTETITIGYYYSPIAFSINYHGYSDKDSNIYFVDYSLPTTSTTVPPDSIEIRATDSSGELLYSADINNVVLSGLSISISDIDDDSWKISLTEGYLLAEIQEEPIYVNTQEITLNKPNNRIEVLYLVYYDFEDKEIKVKKVSDVLIVNNMTNSSDEGGMSSTAITEEDVKNAASLITNGIVLYGIVIINSDELYSRTYSFIEGQTYATFEVDESITILYITLTDKAGRDISQTITRTSKIVPLDLYVHMYSDFDKSSALQNAVIVNNPINTLYIKLYPRR